MTDLERASRQSLSIVVQEIIGPARAGLDFAKVVRAQAEPILSLTDGIQAKINELNDLNAQFQRAIDLLEPHSSIPAVQPLLAYFKTLQPVVVAMSAAETAKLAAAALVLPDPASLVAVAQYEVIKAIEDTLTSGIQQLLSFVEGS